MRVTQGKPDRRDFGLGMSVVKFVLPVVDRQGLGAKQPADTCERRMGQGTNDFPYTFLHKPTSTSDYSEGNQSKDLGSLNISK